jgi:FdhD protein
MGSTERRRVLRWRDGAAEQVPDSLAIEEPLEIEVDGVSVSTTMRTPDHDIELALGWLVAEGALSSIDDIVEAKECFEHDPEDPEQVRRIIQVTTRGKIPVEPRLHATSSACGVCGADLIALTQRTRRWPLDEDSSSFSVATILRLPESLLAAQRGFAASGGLHAAGLFTSNGDDMCIREDVGRHNAVDKVIGWALQGSRLPLRGHALQVSGRASAELVHKAIMAGIPLLASVSAPSTLAVDLARESGLTLVGFVREGSLNVYAGGERLGLA